MPVFGTTAPDNFLTDEWLRRLLIITGCLCMFTASGVVFGWPSLAVILQNHGVFACEELHVNQSSLHNLTSPTTTTTTCASQDLQLSGLYTMGSIAAISTSFFAGITLDYLGPVRTQMIGLLLLISGIYINPNNPYVYIAFQSIS